MQIRRSLWITLAYSNASTVGLFVVSLVLARLLSPSDIGVFSMCVAFVNLLSVIRDVGAAPYLISKSEVSREDIGAVLGLTLTTSWVLGLLLWLGRDELAAFFDEPKMADVLEVMLIGFLLIPMSALMNALLTRNLSAGRSAFVNIGSNLVYAVVVLILAIHGFGALAPAWANAANVITNVVLFWVVMPKGFSLRPRFRGWTGPVRYGGGVLVSNVALVANQSLPDVIIGRALGAYEVGLYSRGNGTVGLFHQVVGPTLTYNALPIISRTHHENAAGVTDLLIKSALLLTVLAWPVYAWIGCHPAAVIELLYGRTWLEAAELVPWLCLAAAVRTPFLIITPALQALGKTFQNARAQTLNLVARVTMLMIFGLHDLKALVIALCIADVLGVAAWAWEARHHLGLQLGKLFAGLMPSLGVGLACLLVGAALQLGLAGLAWPPIVKVLMSGGAVGVGWLIAVLAVRHPVAGELRQLIVRP